MTSKPIHVSSQGTGAEAETPELVKSQPAGRVDPEWKRQQFLRLKELNDNGQLLPPKRKKFSRKEREAVAAAYDGLCAACEEPLRAGFHIDHIVEHDLLGGDDLRNLVPLHPECHRPKTSARAPILAHVHRLAKATFEAPKEPKGRKIQSRNEWPKGRKLESRGFSPRKEKV